MGLKDIFKTKEQKYEELTNDLREKVVDDALQVIMTSMFAWNPTKVYMVSSFLANSSKKGMTEKQLKVAKDFINEMVTAIEKE